MHHKCRNAVYPRSKISRVPVPDELVSWDVEYPDYQAITYTDPGAEGKPWSDPDPE